MERGKKELGFLGQLVKYKMYAWTIRHHSLNYLSYLPWTRKIKQHIEHEH